MQRTFFPALLALLFLLQGCSHLKEPELRSVENLRAENVSINATTLKLDFHYFNPNRSGLQFKSAFGTAWIENQRLGEFIIDTTISIQPLSDFLLPVQLKLDMNHVLRNSATLLIQKEVKIRIEGIARVGKNGIFIKYPLKYEGNHDLVKLLRNLKQ
jgi:hypothetical protein